MSTDYLVKGSTIRSKLDFVETRFGSEAVAALKQRLAGTGIFPLLAASWYPYDHYVEVVEAIADAHYDGDLTRLREVGAESAQTVLSSTYRAFVRKDDFSAFIEGMDRLHHLFYNLGRIDVESNETNCTILQRDKPRYADADIHIAAGFYERAAELHGLEDVSCAFERTSEGIDFRLSWSN